MTTSMSKSDSGLSAGSEEIFDFFCQPCSTENLHLEAVGYCQSCKEFLCDTCCKYHRKTTATRHHKLLDKADMPKSKVVAKTPDDLKETCPMHQGNLLEYFCNSHGELCCIVCLNNDHGSCKVISHIPDVSDGIASSNEFKHLMNDLKTLVSNKTKHLDIIKLSNHDNDRCKSKSLDDISNFRKEVDKLPDKYEKGSVMEVSKLHHENSEKIKAASSDCQVILSDLTARVANLDAKAKSGKNNQLFVDIKMTRQRISAIAAEASDVTDCKITRYGFHQDEKVKEMMSTLSAVWSLSIRQDGEETKARYIDEVNVKEDDDTNDCNINGIVALPGGNIVVTDSSNNSLKLVDMKLHKVTSRIFFSSPPYDVTNTTPNHVAVARGCEGDIEICRVTDILSRSSTINLRRKGFSGICYDRDRFIVACTSESMLIIVDMSGRVLNTISTDKNGDQLFTSPRYITLGRGNDVAYVTDEKAHTLTTMTLSGHVISVYRNDKLKHPRGITVGPDHQVYVCIGSTRTVHQLSSTGEFKQTLLDEQTGMPPFPGAITYDDTRDRLYISSASKWPEQRNHVKFFQIE